MANKDQMERFRRFGLTGGSSYALNPADALLLRDPLNQADIMLLYDDTYLRRQMKWLEQWKEKVDERELVAVAGGIKSPGRDTFRQP